MEVENKPQKPSSFFSVALAFIKNNPSIMLSLALIIFMPLALYFNTNILLNSYEKNTELEFMRKATMVENILDSFLDKSALDQPDLLQGKIDSIRQGEDEIMDFEILAPVDEKHERFKILAAYQKDRIGQEVPEDFYKTVAWNQSEGTSHLESQGGARMLKVEKTFHDADGNRIGLLSVSFSLQKTDNLIAQSFSKSYLILAVTIVLVLLFIFNHARMFRYAVRLAKLREVDEMKDNFISMASHELRSPLAAMRAYLAFLREKEAANITEKGRGYVDNLELSIDRLDTLVDDILEVSRLEQNRIPFEMKALDPDPIISASLGEMKSKALEKNLEIVYDGRPTTRIMVDPDRLKQIIVNLVSNAIKYTPKGKVEIIVKKSYKYLDITVADTGIGVSAEEQQNLFTKFYRVKSKETDGIIGTGLGLWIVKEMTERMKGKINIESIPEVGLHFTISFPIVKE